MSVIAGTTVLVLNSHYILPIIQNRNLWASASMIAILLFTSGHMFNHIRKTPYVAQDKNGGISYFASGFQSQYGLESQVVAAVCELLRFLFLSHCLLLDTNASRRGSLFLCHFIGHYGPTYRRRE